MYENLRSTKLLARNCAVCGRALRDAKSAELGIGPDCAEKHGYNVDVPENARNMANKLIFQIADSQQGVDVVEAVRQLRNLGFTVLAARIATRLFEVHVQKNEETGNFEVKTPYTEAGVQAFRTIPGRQWDEARRVNVIPEGSKGALWKALRKGFPGHNGIAPDGSVFEIPAPQA